MELETETRNVEKEYIVENQIATAETSVQPPNALQTIQLSSPNGSVHHLLLGQHELAYLRMLVREKDARLEKLTEENQYLYAQIERLEARIEAEVKRSDALIDQMQAAAEESSKRAQTIIMHLSQQVERQAEQIEILQELQGFGGAIRQTVKHLKSRILRQPLAAGQKYGYEA
jgi:predicted nuclease with TOPRIM domain